jgi:nucleotide-binding universal stress UspA family protein
MKTILAGYDGTDAAEQALSRSVELARAFGAKVTVVSVVAPQPIDISGAFGLTPYSSYEIGHADPRTDELVWQQHRERVESYFREAGVASDFVGVVGDPADEIVALAVQLGADLIIVGTRHAGFVERVFAASVSQGVAQRAPCDVLIVHTSDTPDTAD